MILSGLDVVIITTMMTAAQREKSVYPIFLFLLNILLALRLMRTQFLDEMGSLEGIYMALASYIKLHPFNLGWWPYWNCGMPFYETYQPALHALVAAVSWITRLSIPSSFHMTEGICYALGPVALYLLLLRLGVSAPLAFGGGLAYTLTSPSLLLFQQVRSDTGAWIALQRFHTMTHYGDGPHVVSLSMLPVAVICLDRALERFTFLRVSMAAVSFTLLVLTNWPGAIVLAIAACALVAASCITRPEKAFAICGTALLAAVTAYGLGCHWMPPSTIAVTIHNAQNMEVSYRFGQKHIVELAFVILVFIALGVLWRRQRWPRDVLFWSLFTAPLLGVVSAHYWFDTELIAQPWRFHLALELGIVGLAVSVIRASHLRFTHGMTFVLACTALVLFPLDYTYSRRSVKRIDIRSTSEYRIAEWLGQHTLPGERAMVPGSVSFWLNQFSSVPQLTGCCEQTNRLDAVRFTDHIFKTDQAAEDRAGETTIAWLRALGVTWVAVCGPRSTEAYHAVRHPGKLDGLLEPVWKDDTDDTIYRVAEEPTSLAHVSGASDAVERMPVNGIDIQPLQSYIAANGADRGTHSTWLNDNELRIEANIEDGQTLGVQVAYHSGWEADENGIKWLLKPDTLGLITVIPTATGFHTLHLRFTGGREAHWTWIVSVLFMFLVGIIMIQAVVGLLRRE